MGLLLLSLLAPILGSLLLLLLLQLVALLLWPFARSELGRVSAITWALVSMQPSVL